MVTRVPTNQRQDIRCWREHVGHDHEKHRHRQQSRDSHGYFLAGVGRHVESKKRDEGNQQARHYEVKHVEERSPLDQDVIVDEDVGLRATAEYYNLPNKDVDYF